MSKISVDEFNALMDDECPWAVEAGMFAEMINNGNAQLRIPFRQSTLRPGGTIAGPTMMALADTTMYAVALSVIGGVTLTVTTNFNINFLNKPRPADLICRGSILKQGKRLIVMEASIYSEGQDNLVAHATGTYSIPPLK